MKLKTSLLALTAVTLIGITSAKAATYTVPLCGLTFLANSLDAGGGASLNRADAVIPYSDGDNIQIWTGVSWDTWTMDSLSTTGWLNPSGADAPLASLPVLGPGVGFFYGNNSAKPNITFNGTVRPSPTVVAIPIGLKACGSAHAYGGLVTTGPIDLPVQDGDNIQKWNCLGYWEVYSRDSGSSTGWLDPLGADGPEPTLNVGEGFFYGNNVGPFNWTQF